VAGLLHDVLSTVFDPHGELGGAERAGAGAAVTGALTGLVLVAGLVRSRDGRRRPLVLAEATVLALAFAPTWHVLTVAADGGLLRGLVLAFDALALAALVAPLVAARRHSAWRSA
jgi:hypothetical protein